MSDLTHRRINYLLHDMIKNNLPLVLSPSLTNGVILWLPRSPLVPAMPGAQDTGLYISDHHRRLLPNSHTKTNRPLKMLPCLKEGGPFRSTTGGMQVGVTQALFTQCCSHILILRWEKPFLSLRLPACLPLSMTAPLTQLHVFSTEMALWY